MFYNSFDEAVNAGVIHKWQKNELADAEKFNSNNEFLVNNMAELYNEIEIVATANKLETDTALASLELIRTGAPSTLDTLLEIDNYLTNEETILTDILANVGTSSELFQ